MYVCMDVCILFIKKTKVFELVMPICHDYALKNTKHCKFLSFFLNTNSLICLKCQNYFDNVNANNLLAIVIIVL